MAHAMHQHFGMSRISTAFCGVLWGALGCACAAQPAPKVATPRTTVEAQPPAPGGVQTLPVTVNGADHTPVQDQNAVQMHLQAETASARPVSVVLGPGWYVDEQGIHFRTQPEREQRPAPRATKP